MISRENLLEQQLREKTLEIERLNNIIKEKDKDFELLRKAQLKKCQEYENLEKLNNANYQSFIETNKIIIELEKWLKNEIKRIEELQNPTKSKLKPYGEEYNNYTLIIGAYDNALDKLQELKGSDKE